MPGRSASRKNEQGTGNQGMSFKGAKDEKPERSRYSYVPMSYYWLKDLIKDIVSRDNFPDAMAVVFAAVSASIAFPFFPPVILVPLLIITFIVTFYSPLSGLMLLLFETLPMFMYQAPLLAWVMLIFMSLALFIGNKHYRSITFVYTLIMLPLSVLGTYVEIPAFIMGSLFIGFRRACASAIVIILMIVMLCGLTGIQNTAPLIYNSQAAHLALSNSTYLGLFVPSMPAPTLSTFISSASIAFSHFLSLKTTTGLFTGFQLALGAVIYGFGTSAIQIVLWLLVIFAMTNYVLKSRSGFKGTEASAFSLIILAGYTTLAYFEKVPLNQNLLIGFVATPIILFALEYNGIEVVKSLSVMKKDFLGKFAEAFQDLTSGTKETLDDIANYDQTKAELKEAVLDPIEHREISGAYKVKPAKGILLFGPPGTGKTLIMRALANEARAKFFYVKTSSILSPFQGESAQTLSKIFNTVRKNTPAILFFDEIDSVAGNRDASGSDSNTQILATLLSEMDGFQKMEGVVIVGSTNAPHLLDPAMLRPGRFDKIIYMPLPDKDGRAKIFAYYLKKLPLASDFSFAKLSELSSRYSGADIKNVCNEVARRVAEEAVKQHKVLGITSEDVINVLKATKPSTSLMSIEKFNSFKLDYERRTHPEFKEDKDNALVIDDVVGLELAKKALYEAIEVPILHPNLIKKYDIQNIKGILMFGPPGTGKTMLMKAVANELDGINLIVLSGSEISKNGFENALSTIKETFNRARENTPAIIFIDEIDAILPTRNDSTELSVQITSEFLQQIDGIKQAGSIILVGSTNRPDILDTAILRPGRLDKFIFVPPPGRADRAKIFEHNLKKAPCSSDIDFEALADETDGYTGADIANICREAKMVALEGTVAKNEDQSIDMKSMLDIIHNIKPSAPPGSLSRYMRFMSIYGGR